MKILVERRAAETVWRFFGLHGARREIYSAIWRETDPNDSRNPFRDSPGVSDPRPFGASDSPLRLGRSANWDDE